MKKEDLVSFLKFRQKFTSLEWFELNKAVSEREREKAAKLVLDDFDVEVILDRVVSNSFLDVKDGRD